MPALAAVRLANAKYSPSYIPVAVFVGGTSGIGAGLARAFARQRNGNAHIILVGRNRAAAQDVLASLPTPTVDPAPAHEFVECDVTLMRNVKKTTDELVARLSRVNFLVMSPGYMTMKGRDETEEGIDRKLAVNYYGRWKFIDGLLPLLRNAKDAGEDAKVMSVLAPGKGGKIDLDDLGLKKSFSVPNASLAGPTYNDLMVEAYAEREPDITFIHAYPGLVNTPLAKGQASDRLLRYTYPLTKGLMYAFGVSGDESGEYMLHALLQAQKGASRTGSRGEDLGSYRSFSSDEARKRLWEHTVVATATSN